MKKTKFNQYGFSHYIVPVVTIALLVGVFGAYTKFVSHADTASTLCGSGYTYKWGTRLKTSSGDARGAILELYTNSSADKACSFVYSTGDAYGVAKPMSVTIDIETKSSTVVTQNKDSGTYKINAGPVYVSYHSYLGSSGKYKVCAYGSMNYNGTSRASGCDYIQ